MSPYWIWVTLIIGITAYNIFDRYCDHKETLLEKDKDNE